ncbi:tetratricopeptide repeat protein [Lacipirellula limnantheis]|uniref:tetratricopeptide repeat protein n=1 Tax=Lacipirellula limnantheis TaxID=2528024 RepID=UPI00143D9447|nr:tetratricopeptide repeat protein [Lacipirellula limnantheis]
MSSTAATTAPRRPWIVSPAWDLFYLVLTPLLIVPTVLVAARQWLRPEDIYLAVISFASLGHHLPGFMRAYGDRELFSRFRWRFLLAPPLIFALALIFTPPDSVAHALNLPWRHLHGLELILLIWGTWHGLMQTYGFMRIYDLRRGENDRYVAKLDHALCLAIFAAGVVFSDTRMFGVAGAMWQCGLPIFGPDTLALLRWIVGGLSGLVIALYATHLVNRRLRGLPVNWVKLLLAASTGWFYWYCGRLSTNLLIGIAMFEIYHAVQYNAIVWIYNRRLLEKAGERFGPLGFLFRDRTTMLGIYLAAIAAYSSIRFVTAHAGDRMFSGDLDDARQWLIAAFVTSSILHFYYDGFIWKVSDRRTQDNLVDAPVPAFDRFVPSFIHAGKWATLLAVIAMLIGSERMYAAGGARQQAMLAALARLTPDVAEAKAIAVQLDGVQADERYAAGLAALQRGDAAAAVGPLEVAVKLDPKHFRAWLQLGDAFLALDQPAAAVEPYRRAVALGPEVVDARVALAEALLKSDQRAAAEQCLREGLARDSESPELNLTLAILLEQTGRTADAEPFRRRAVESGLGR